MGYCCPIPTPHGHERNPMSDLNNLSMSGRLTRDAELTYLPSQTPVAKAGLACNRKVKDQDKTCFIDLTVMGKPAETFAKYLKKGDPVIITGRLELDQWEAKDGTKKSKHSVFVTDFTFLGNGQGGQQRERAPAQRDDREYAPLVGDEDSCPF